MDNLKLTISKDRINDPSAIAQDLYELGNLLSTSNLEINQIKDRGIVKRFFANNVSDIAEQMLKQNEALAIFLNVLQTVVVLSSYNSVHIANIYEKFTEKVGHDKTVYNKYFSYAKDFLYGAITNTEKVTTKFNNIDNNLEDLKISIIKKDKIDYEQDLLISEIKENLQLQADLSKATENKIHALFSEIDVKTDVDKKQDKQITEIIQLLKSKDELDSMQSEKIGKLENIIYNNIESIKLLENRVADIQKESIENFRFSQSNKKQDKLIAYLSIIIAVVAVVLSFIR